ncbi:SGNH/GDSL hydrolase family protein [Vibrio alginolyticus]|uniref:SGNH/GDSL hydrolase family protein n=1 Tax=Vibrio alginolyticus TaxID=663 RepID=UPI003F6761A8
MTQNIEQRTEVAVKKYESASDVVEKIANTDGYVETGSGHKKSFPKISREWDENSQKMQKDWGDESQRLQTEFQNESAVIREDWQNERDSLSIKSLGVKPWQSGESENNINQQRRWTDNHTYLPKSVPAVMDASGPDESWIPYTADKSSTLEDVFGRKPTDLIAGITLTPNSKHQYPKLLAMGGTWEMEDGLKAFVVDDFVITSGDILRITDTNGDSHDAVRLSGASREWTTQRFASVIANVDQLKRVEGVKEGQQIELLGYHAEGDGGGGSLIWMLSAPHAANDATVFAVGSGFWVRRNLTISPRQAGWQPDKQGPVRIRELLNLGVKFTKPSRLTSLQGQAARWAAGQKAPVCFFGDSTTDGRVTTLDGENLATIWNINRLVNGDVPDDLVYDHDDTEVPNAYPNVLQRILREFHANNLVRVYNAGYRGKQAQDGWAVDNVHNAVYGNATYSDVEWMGIMFGLNDSYKENAELLERRTYIENQALILDAFARGVQPALMSCPPSNNTAETGDYGNNGEVSELIDQVKRRLSHEYGIEFIDINRAIKHWIYTNGDKVCFASASSDGLHLNDIGHLKKAEFLFKTAQRENVPTLNEDRHCFDVVHSAVRYTLSRNDISSADPMRGANKLYQNGVIESNDIDKVLGKNVIDLWVWNERRDHSLIYRAYKDARMSFHLANREDLPRFVIEAQLFTSNDYHKETIFDDVSPECIGTTGGGRSDFPCFLGKLRYGLNRIRLVMPATAKNLFDSGAITGYLTVGWLDFIADRQENRLPVMHHNYGFSYMDKAHWRDVVAGRGRVIHPPVDTGTPKNYVRNIVSPSLHGFNTYSLKKPGDTVEFRFQANFPSGTGVVLSWNKIDDSAGYPPEYDKDILFSSAGVFFFYLNTSPTPYVRFAFLSPVNGGTPPLLETGVDISEVQDKTLLIKMQLLQDYTLKVTMLRADLSQLYEGLITDPAVVGEIATGYCGGSFSNGSSASGAFELEYLQLREYKELI